MSAFGLRPLRPEDVAASARLHQEVLGTEFLGRCGDGFVRLYHRAWLESPVSLALTAVDESGELVGVLLGAFEPETHYRTMVRKQGPVLALRLVVRAASHPSFARELVATRAVRYARGVTRILAAALPLPPCRHQTLSAPGGSDTRASRGDSDSIPRSDGGIRTPSVGEITHVMVRQDARGRGVGRALLEEARRVCKNAGLNELVLVTPPDLAARTFYEHLGWRYAGKLTSRSDEDFVRYRLPLNP